MGRQDNKLHIDITDNRNVFNNTAQDIIVTTKDKIELVLLKTEKYLANKKEWITPMGLIITCVITLLTADFKDFLFSASVWKAVFIITTVICSIWLIHSLCNLFKNFNKGNINDIINQIISESNKE